MNNINVFYAGGGGCNWLSHTVGALETKNYNILDRSVGDKFDNVLLKSKHIKCVHWDYDMDSPDEKIHTFSSKYMFNISIAGHTKNPQTHLSLQEKFDRHTTDALYQMSNECVYVKDIILEHEWLYNNPNKFIDELFSLLDRNGFNYTKNREFVLSSIKNYIKTNTSPNLYYDNYNSLMWLGWCHAVVMLNDIFIPVELNKCKTVREISTVLWPHRDLCLTEIRKFIIPGTLNE